jgi:hypothetical protein
MFVANPIEPSHSPIRYVGAPGPAVPVRGVATVPTSASYRLQGGRLVTMAGLVIAAAVIGFGAGYAANGSSSAGEGAARKIDVRPVPGEFRLAPGLDQPPGVVVPLSGTAGIKVGPVPGEFRLAPGLDQPPGVAVPLG